MIKFEQIITFQVPSPTLGILAPVFKVAEKSAILKCNTKVLLKVLLKRELPKIVQNQNQLSPNT